MFKGPEQSSAAHNGFRGSPPLVTAIQNTAFPTLSCQSVTQSNTVGQNEGESTRINALVETAIEDTDYNQEQKKKAIFLQKMKETKDRSAATIGISFLPFGSPYVRTVA